MEKRKKLIIILLVSLVIAWLFWPKTPAMVTGQENLNPGDDTAPGDPLPPVTPVPPVPNPNIPAPSPFPLKRGSKGSLVKQLQEIINFNDSAFGLTNGIYLRTDSDFGDKTYKRVLAVFGSPEVSEKQFKIAVERRKNAIPVMSRMDDNFPLRIGSYGPKTEALNLALGIYKKGEAYSKNYTAKTAAAVNNRLGVNSLDQSNYYRIVKK